MMDTQFQRYNNGKNEGISKESNYVIDKVYAFQATQVGSSDDYMLHVKLTHEEAMDYGNWFAEDEQSSYMVDFGDRFKEEVDRMIVDDIVKWIYDNYLEALDDVESDEYKEYQKSGHKKDIDEFYDYAWIYVGDTYIGIYYGNEFIKDCRDYYLKHK